MATSGMAALSGKLALVQDVDRLGIAGALLYLPVYGYGQGTRGPEQTLLGWVYAPFSMDILMQGVRLDTLEGLEVSIYDGQTMTAEALLYSSSNSDERARRAAYESVEHLSIAGQPWTARVRFTAIFEAESARNTPTLVAVAGDGVWDWRNQTGEVTFSSRWKSMLNYRDDEIGNTISEWERLIHPEDRAFALATARNCAEGLISIIHLEIRI